MKSEKSIPKIATHVFHYAVTHRITRLWSKDNNRVLALFRKSPDTLPICPFCFIQPIRPKYRKSQFVYYECPHCSAKYQCSEGMDNLKEYLHIHARTVYKAGKGVEHSAFERHFYDPHCIDVFSAGYLYSKIMFLVSLILLFFGVWNIVSLHILFGMVYVVGAMVCFMYGISCSYASFCLATRQLFITQTQTHFYLWFTTFAFFWFLNVAKRNDYEQIVAYFEQQELQWKQSNQDIV